MTQTTIQSVEVEDLDPILQAELSAMERMINDLLVLGFAASGQTGAEIVTGPAGEKIVRLTCEVVLAEDEQRGAA